MGGPGAMVSGLAMNGPNGSTLVADPSGAERFIDATQARSIWQAMNAPNYPAPKQTITSYGGGPAAGSGGVLGSAFRGGATAMPKPPQPIPSQPNVTPGAGTPQGDSGFVPAQMMSRQGTNRNPLLQALSSLG